jgi:hypothetical protein
MNLSEHLTLLEFEHSDKAEELGISNLLPPHLLPSAIYVAKNLFEPVRTLLGVPIKVTSGYRSEELNLAVRGVATSQHCKAEALDLIPVGMAIRDAFDRITSSASITFDQLILEHDKAGNIWIHVSRKTTGNRMQVIPYLLKP